MIDFIVDGMAQRGFTREQTTRALANAQTRLKSEDSIDDTIKLLIAISAATAHLSVEDRRTFVSSLFGLNQSTRAYALLEVLRDQSN